MAKNGWNGYTWMEMAGNEMGWDAMKLTHPI